MDSLAPSGAEVITTGAGAQGSVWSQLGGLLVYGLGRKIDAELGVPTRVPDTSETAPLTNATAAPPKSTGFVDALTALTPVQLGGLVVAGGLAWALATGKFA